MSAGRDKKKTIAVVVIVCAALAVCGVAVALWSATGSGSGRASSLTAQAITVTATAGTADLYPGFTAGDVAFTASNPNPYPVTFTSFVEGTITSSDQTACPAANITVNHTGAISVAIAANAVNEPHTIADVVTMAAGAPDGCQNKSFTITLTLSGSQS
jgi:hypothetical protein